ncbi:hypothetical protein [Pseudactinotalea terrae]|uniref:hypothetical protein n=1 Tax=Pseudactinotalea terrae TaxID=1743262 RepID=UPI0012E19F5F|nr:hypothetical protein [Pseudactinotalea terrae]
MSLLISRSGIAAAAHVQRPVVSVWQSRLTNRNAPAPFPEPVDGTPELFALEDVVDWQARTGRGNNPSFADDAPLYAVLADGVHGEHDDAVTALMALAALTETDLLDLEPAELVAAAAAVDPEDTGLLREVTTVAHRRDLRELAARQIEAAFGAAGAIEAIAAVRSRAGADRRWTISEGAVSLLRDLCQSLVPGGAIVSDGGAHPSDLALRTTVGDVERSIAWCASAEASPGADRPLRRRALAAGVMAGPEEKPGIRVLQMPPRNSPRAVPAQVLHAIDEFMLNRPPGAVGLILGPASVLCDAMTDRDARLLRADLLRTGRLRAVVRLPQGLVLDRPRAELALWVLGDADPEATIADRLLVTGEVKDLEQEAVDGVVSDLVAALAGVAQIRVRAFACCRPVRTAQLLATDGALVPQQASTPPPRSTEAAAATALTRVDQLHRAGVDLGIELTTAAEPARGRTVTLGALVASKEARMIPGKRVPLDEIPDGAVRVLGAAELSGEIGEGETAGVDILMAHGRYARAITEPGDVVVLSNPRPRAIVDADGGCLVTYPARILRLRGGSPRAVAAAINALPARAGAWETWAVPVPAPSEAPGLEAALRSLAERRRALHDELDELAGLETDMIDGVTSGALVVSPRDKE